jgi:hypothetical protein
MPLNLADRNMFVNTFLKNKSPQETIRVLDLWAVNRPLRAERLLIENIRTLLQARGLEASSLAMWCGHRPAWISKVLSAERGVQIKDVGRIADFFGLTVSQLFQHGISPLAERRRGARRSLIERRSAADRRRDNIAADTIHPDVTIRFQKKY